MQLGWIPPAAAALSEAEALVKDSDVAIVFVGLSSELEGEEMRGVRHPRLPRRRPHQPRPAGAAREAGDDRHGHRQAGGRRADERQRRRRDLGGGASLRRARGLVRGRGSRHGDRGDAGGREQPRGTTSGDVLQERRPVAPVHRLRDEGPHVPLLQGRAALPVRLRAELLELRVLGTRRETDGGGRRDSCDRQEHLVARRRRGRAAVRRRRPGARGVDPQACAGSSASTCVPARAGR